MKDINTLLGELTIPEKAALLEGYKSWKTNAIPRLDIPAICLTDGPVGVRKKSKGVGEGALGLGSPYPSTAFPTPVCIANSWNLQLAEQVGEAMGEECVAYGVNVLLGPALNLKRDPRCGRNFEYYSEDPLLAGKMAAAFTRGLQSTGTAACPKHFALNNSENFRYMGDSVVDERAARELYLKAFEICVKEAHPRTMMCSYNKVNGTHASQNKWLLTDLLRNEWGYDGLVMSDWGAVVDRVEGVKAGLDLDMPGGILANRRAIIEAAESGELPMEDLDRAVANVLKLVADAQRPHETKAGEAVSANEEQISGCAEKKSVAVEEKKSVGAEKKDMEALLKDHDLLTVKMATDCAVLLKNEDVLPLAKQTKVLVVGDLFDTMRYQGAGSSGLAPVYVTGPKDAFDRDGAGYVFARGYKEITHEPDEALEKEAVSAAANADVIVFFGGLTELFESEGYDRENLNMPQNQLQLIDKLCDAGKPVVVVLFGGSPMELPFADKVSAILNMFLPGQTGGEACRRILYGEAEPGGRLSETWMKSNADIPFGEQYSKHKIEQYRENIYVGYRYFDQVPEKIRYPFGYGLSYTEFAYSDMTVKHIGKLSGNSRTMPERGAEITVSLTITNIGRMDGSEVVQLYVGKNANAKVFKADKELKAFTKVYLKAGESRRVELKINEADLAYYHTKNHEWVVENGTYPILVGANSRDIRLKLNLMVNGYRQVEAPYSHEVMEAYAQIADCQISDQVFEETIGRPIPEEPAVLPYTLESSLMDYPNTRMGRLIRKAILFGVSLDGKKYERLPEGRERDALLKNQQFILNLVPRNCPRSLIQSGGGGILQMNLAHAINELANGHVWKAIGLAIRGEKKIPLPYEAKTK